MKNRGKKNREDSPRRRVNMTEARQDLQDSKESIRKLLLLRQSLYKGDTVSQTDLEQQKVKALEALDHLFEDELDNAS